MTRALMASKTSEANLLIALLKMSGFSTTLMSENDRVLDIKDIVCFIMLYWDVLSPLVHGL